MAWRGEQQASVASPASQQHHSLRPPRRRLRLTPRRPGLPPPSQRGDGAVPLGTPLELEEPRDGLGGAAPEAHVGTQPHVPQPRPHALTAHTSLGVLKAVEAEAGGGVGREKAQGAA